MHSTRLLHQLFLALMVAWAAHALLREAGRFHGRSLLDPGNGNVAGDGDGDGKSQPSSSKSGILPSDPTSSTGTPSNSASSPTHGSTSSTGSTSIPSTTPTTRPTTTGTKATSKTSQTTKTAQTTTAKAQDKPSTTPKPVVSTSFAVITKTKSDGEKETMTTAVKTTTTPGLSADHDDGSSGMSPTTRNTIIGVVVGVGGAVIVGALIIVAYRVWGRKKHAEESDGLMAYDGGYTGGDKMDPPSSSAFHSGTTRTPFQSTLENYHQPGQVNASANF